MKKLFLSLTALAACSASHAQLVNNGGFELGAALCQGGTTGVYYIAQGFNGSPYVTGWTGINPSQTVSYPQLTGQIWDNSATCTLASFPAGYSPASGNRAIALYNHYNGVSYFNDERARSLLITSLQGSATRGGRRHQICIKVAGGAAAGYSTGTLEVAMANSSNPGAAVVVASIPIVNDAVWRTYTAQFSVSAGSGGYYNMVELRIKKDATANREVKAFIDDFQVYDITSASYYCGANTIDVTGSFPVGLKQANPTAVPAIAVAEDLKIWPNPAAGVLNVTLGNNADVTNATGQVLDIQGRVIKSFAISGPTTPLDVSEMPAGVYQLRIAAGDRLAHARFVKQ